MKDGYAISCPSPSTFAVISEVRSTGEGEGDSIAGGKQSWSRKGGA